MDECDAAAGWWCDCPAGVLAAELAFLLFKTGAALLEPTVRLYITDAVCRQAAAASSSAHHNDSSTSLRLRCSRLGELDPDVEIGVQATAALYLLCYKLVVHAPSAGVLVFCGGAWSDRVGRKPPVVASCVGTLVGVAFYLASGVVIDSSVPAFLALLYVGTAVRGLLGKSTLISMAIHRSPLSFCVCACPTHCYRRRRKCTRQSRSCL